MDTAVEAQGARRTTCRPSTTSRARSCSSRSDCCGRESGSWPAAWKRFRTSATTSPTTSTTNRSSSCATRREQHPRLPQRLPAPRPPAHRRLRHARSALQCRFHGWQWKPGRQGDPHPRPRGLAGCPDMEDERLRSCRRSRSTPGPASSSSTSIPTASRWPSYLAPVPEYTDCFEFEKMRYRWYKSVRLPCNWKVALEAFSEGYHVVATHPQLLDIQGDDVTRSFTIGKHGMFGYPTADAAAGAPSAAHQQPDARRPAPGHRRVLPGTGRPR